MKFNKKWILASAVSAALAACGGGGSSSGSNSGGAGSSIDGGVSKGIVIGGVVNAYGLRNGVFDESNPIAEPTETLEDGSYKLTINRGYEGPVLIKITADEGTLMRCDLAVCERESDGSAKTVFGGNYKPSPNFEMSALLPSAEEEVSASVTPLSSAAASLARKRIKAGADAAAAALSANAQIANRLGLTSSNLLTQPVLDITSPDAVNGATRETLDFNLKATAVVGAALDEGESLEDALEQFVGQYVEQGVAEREDSPSDSITFDEILGAAKILIDEIKKSENVQNPELAEAEGQINNRQNTAKTGSTEPTQGDVPEGVGSEGLQAVKEFVQQLRDVATAAILEEQQQGVDSFSGKVEQAATLVGEDQELVFGAAAATFSAISEAFDAVQNEEYDQETFIASNDIEVALSKEGERTIYSVKTTLKGAAVDITASDNSSITEESTRTESNPDEQVLRAEKVAIEEEMADEAEYSNTVTESETFDLVADLDISGSVTSEALTLSIGDDSSLSGTLSGTYSREETHTESTSGYSYQENDDDAFTLQNLAATIIGSLATNDIEVSENEIYEPVTFTGSIIIEIGEFDSEEIEDYYENSSFDENGYNYSFGWDEESKTILNDLNISLSGKLETESGDETSLSMSAMLDGFIENCKDKFDYQSDSQGTTESGEYSCELNEEEGYAEASISVAFGLSLSGIGEAIDLSASATRTGSETADFDITLNYAPGNSLVFSHSADFSEDDDKSAPVFTVRNQNDVVMTLTENDSGEIEGTINTGGDDFASIDEDAGAPVVTFADGTFETF